jgi:hypothetical protein
MATDFHTLYGGTARVLALASAFGALAAPAASNVDELPSSPPRSTAVTRAVGARELVIRSRSHTGALRLA